MGTAELYQEAVGHIDKARDAMRKLAERGNAGRLLYEAGREEVDYEFRYLMRICNEFARFQAGVPYKALRNWRQPIDQVSR